MEENLVRNQCQKLSGSLMLNIIYSLESVAKIQRNYQKSKIPT